MVMIPSSTQKCEQKYCNTALGYNFEIEMTAFLEQLYCQTLFSDAHHFYASESAN